MQIEVEEGIDSHIKGLAANGDKVPWWLAKKKYEFEYPEDKMIELSKKVKAIVDDKARYTDWSTRADIKANLQFDLAVLLDEYGYPPVTIDDVFKEVLEQAENFKKYA